MWSRTRQLRWGWGFSSQTRLGWRDPSARTGCGPRHALPQSGQREGHSTAPCPAGNPNAAEGLQAMPPLPSCRRGPGGPGTSAGAAPVPAGYQCRCRSRPAGGVWVRILLPRRAVAVPVPGDAGPCAAPPPPRDAAVSRAATVVQDGGEQRQRGGGFGELWKRAAAPAGG